MKKHISKRVLTLVLALVLVFALSLGALAAWNQFQGGVTNNGVIDPTPTPPPITNPSTVLRVGLPTNDPYNPEWYSNSVWNSIDVTPLISEGKAYTLYNGGVTNGTLGGARLGITDLATGDTSSLQFPGNESNGFLLSTPVIAGNDIYAAVTGIDSFATSPAFDGNYWTANPSGWAQFYNDFVWFGANATGSVESNDYDIEFPYDFNTFTITTNISTSDYTDITYSIALKDSNNTPYPIIENVTAPGTGASLFTYNGVTIPAGHYKLIVTIGSHTCEGKVYSVTFSTNKWTLYKIANFATSPLVTTAQDSTHTDVADWGQANTPITYADGNLYWGIYGGTKSYYQFNPATSALAVFDANDDFYLAGATVLSENSGDYVYFGGDSGKIYKRSVSAFDSSTPPVPPVDVGAGKIRSSVATDGTDLYFTTQGSAGTGTIQKYSTALTYIADCDLDPQYISTSTPVISANSLVYISAYKGFTEGQVYVLDTSLSSLDSVYSGAPVQASPIVYSNTTSGEEFDYVYFTTNSGSGAGYCYYNDIQNGDTGIAWTAGGASGNRYSVQGFAADGGYLVYGDDGGMLYIIH